MLMSNTLNLCIWHIKKHTTASSCRWTGFNCVTQYLSGLVEREPKCRTSRWRWCVYLQWREQKAVPTITVCVFFLRLCLCLSSSVSSTCFRNPPGNKRRYSKYIPKTTTRQTLSPHEQETWLCSSYKDM